MVNPRFAKTVHEVASEVLIPVGFGAVRREDAGNPPAVVFVKPWRGRLLAAVGLQAARGKRAFRVELGVIPAGGDFYAASPFSDMGPWRTSGLRVDLAKLTDASTMNTSFDGDFFLYQDGETLRSQVRRALSLALDVGEGMWKQLGERLLKANRR